jgi:hypothetical protein
MTQPDDRIKQSIFQQNVSYFDDSILSSTRHGLFTSDMGENNNNGQADPDHQVNMGATCFSHQIDGKMRYAHKVADWEQDRVAKHKVVRENQLNI